MKINQPVTKLEFESGKIVELTEEEYEELKNYFSNMFLIPSIPTISYPTIPNSNPFYPQSPVCSSGTERPLEETVNTCNNTEPNYTNKLVNMVEPDF